MSKRFFTILLLVIIIFFFTIIGQRGILRIHRLTKERNQIKVFNEKIREENLDIQEEISSLKNDRSYIEKIARQELGLVKEDEIVYQFRSSENE